MSNDLPSVRITNSGPVARNTRIEINGNDISRWVERYELVGDVHDVTVLRLDLFVGDLAVEAPAREELTVGLRDALVRNGWQPPPGPATEATACDTCGGEWAVEHPEFLPCPDCRPADHLAERVMCEIPTNDADSKRAARRVLGDT